MDNSGPVFPVGKVVEKLEEIFDVLDSHLGDSDPDHYESEEDWKDDDPVGWAANRISELIQELKP